jgi:hypothetical protein
MANQYLKSYAKSGLTQINASDGDIGFHFLMDGDDIKAAMLRDPNGVKVFQDQAKGPLLD